ncbi:hypothetical protein [Streptomyces lunaelactis]|uniref:hypothetical protein n=1 Tax=Streptomyces lunaelactis TaxID=1535768 RepID=UPI001585357E|nr:hypothetical protein [Streptomyces lunaelactis]NUL09061.1 hypothetical protein [Streptomyces lunaelactis]
MTFTPRTWVVGEVVTAALMNQEIRDQINSMLAAWTAYTPAWTAVTTNPVVNNGTITGRHMKVGRTCHTQIDLVTGSTTTYGSGGYSFSLPFTSASVGTRTGLAHVFLSQRYLGQFHVAASATTGTLFFPASGSVSNLSQAASNVPVTWANGLQLRISLTYETA